MAHILACGRTKVKNVMKLLPARYIEELEQNQKIAHCCRHPENHDIEAWYSCETDAKKGIPDIYKLYCTCGRVHVRFCVGGNHPDSAKYSREERPDLYDLRPKWEVR